MMLKLAFLILMVIVALGAWGKLRTDRRPRIPGRKPDRIARYCGECGMPRIGDAPCPCGKGR